MGTMSPLHLHLSYFINFALGLMVTSLKCNIVHDFYSLFCIIHHLGIESAPPKRMAFTSNLQKRKTRLYIALYILYTYIHACIYALYCLDYQLKCCVVLLTKKINHCNRVGQHSL